MSRNYRDFPGRHIRPPRGICRWCAIVIKNPDDTVNKRRTFCSRTCVDHYLIRSDPQEMRKHVFHRDRGLCRRCGYHHGFVHGDWQADHVLPLMIAFGDPKFWEPDNVVILCKIPCHQEKTREDRRKYRKRDRRKIKDTLDRISFEDDVTK